MFASFRSHRSRRTAVLWLLRFGSEHRPGSTVWLSGPMHVCEYTQPVLAIARSGHIRIASSRRKAVRREAKLNDVANCEFPGSVVPTNRASGLRLRSGRSEGDGALVPPSGSTFTQYTRHQAPEIELQVLALDSRLPSVTPSESLDRARMTIALVFHRIRPGKS